VQPRSSKPAASVEVSRARRSVKAPVWLHQHCRPFPLGIGAPSYYNAGVLPLIDCPSLLGCLTRDRLVEVGRSTDASLHTSATKERQIEAFFGAGQSQLAALVGLLWRDELKLICRLDGWRDKGRARAELAYWVFAAMGESALAPAPTSPLTAQPAT
jgi:hypothetical protein